MKTVISWIRECDEADFARFFALNPALPLVNARTNRAAANIKQAAGLLLTGGPDVSMEFLRQPVPDPSVIEEPDVERDRWESHAITVALERGLPIFAICKGMQFLNVALGGTLRLDIPGHDLPEQRLANIQPLRFAAGAAPQFPQVNSSHHQAVDQLGDGLEVEAWSRSDGIIEQVRLRDYPFAQGVQYHPERDLIYWPLFAEFFAQVEAQPAR